jgi:transcriptional regulator with XRE-family HTH domain
MNITLAFGHALKRARALKNLTQEDFSQVSSRTYVSTLERGIYAPTLAKIDSLANRIGIHPLTLISMAYLLENPKLDRIELLEQVQSELNDLLPK